MHLGCSIGLAVGGSCQSSSVGWCWAVFRRNHPRGSGHLPSVKISRLMMAVRSGGEDGYVGSPEQALSHA